jgi:hypothetical protein
MYIAVKDSKPPKEIIKAFNLKGDIKLLPGGQGRTFQVEEIVVKFYPFTSEEEIRWLAELSQKLDPSSFRLQQYIKAKNGRYLIRGWGAHQFLEGESREDFKHLKLKRELLQDFHEIIKKEPEPQFMKQRNHPWAVADRMVWGEETIKCHKNIFDEIRKLLDFIEPIDLPFQLIQGDPDNMIFSDNLVPAIIDLSLYYRPADFSLAVLAADKLCCWCEAECRCFDSEEVYEFFSDIDSFDQLLLRAVLRRSLEYEGLSKFEKSYLDAIKGVVPAIEFVYDLFRKK